MKKIRKSRLAGILIFILIFSFVMALAPAFLLPKEAAGEDRNIDSTRHPLVFRENANTYLKRVTVKDSGTDGTGSNWVSEPIYIGKSTLFTLWLKTFNNSGNTVAKVSYDFSNTWDRTGSPSNTKSATTGIEYDWSGTESMEEDMGTENNKVAYSIKPIDAEGNEKLGLWVRFILEGGIGNGEFDAEMELITK